MATLKSHFSGSKLIFYFLFHGMQIAVFVVGWYAFFFLEFFASQKIASADNFCRWKQASDERLAALNDLQYSVWISRGAGLVLSVDGALILLPMCRTFLRYVRPKFKWLHLDETQWFHRQVAYSLLFFTIIHTTSHYVK